MELLRELFAFSMKTALYTPPTPSKRAKNREKNGNTILLKYEKSPNLKSVYTGMTISYKVLSKPGIPIP